MLLGDVVDQLHDDHGLADAGAAEQADLAALGVGRQQVDHLDAGLEHLRGRRQVLDVRGVAVDRPALLGLDRLAEVDRLAEQVEDAAQRRLPDRDGDRAAGVDDLGAARKAVRRVHRDRAHAVVAEVLLHLADERAVPSPRSTVIAWLISGSLSGKTASITTPWISSMRPTFFVCVAASIGLLSVGPSRAPRRPATTSMISCVISACLARFICSVKPLDQLARVVGRVAHRGHARAVLGRRRLEQRPEHRDLDVVGDQPVQDLLRVGLVLDQRVVARAPLRPRPRPPRIVGVLEREQRLAAHLLGERRDVAVVEDLDLVEVAVDVGATSGPRRSRARSRTRGGR